MRKPTPRTFAVTTMYVGMGATLAGNAATADWSDPIAVAVAAFPALSLIAVFEMVMRRRTPAKKRTARLHIQTGVAVAIMLGAAYLSLGHLIELAHVHGQTGAGAVVVAALPDLMMLLAATVMQDTPAPAARRAPARTRKAKATPAPIDVPAPVPSLSGRRRTRAA